MRQSVVKVAYCCPCFSIRRMNNVIHFAILCINALHPASLGSCSVDSGTLQIAPFRMNQDIAVFMRLRMSAGGWNICVLYHAVSSTISLMYQILLPRFSALW